MSPTPQPDIAIIGGGPSGLSFAAICERRGLSYIVYERSAHDTPPRGGALDLHPGSGQRAMREAGVYSEFRKYARSDDASLTTTIVDHHGAFAYSWGEERDAPELDRFEIQKVLLQGIPEGKIVWRKKLAGAERDVNDGGRIVLRFEDGERVSGFRLVVGADGAGSRVRPLITSTEPRYWGKTFIEGSVSESNPFWKRLRDVVGLGPMMCMGRGIGTRIQIQGRGQYNISYGIDVPWEFHKETDFTDQEAIKKMLLSEKFYGGGHDQFFKDVIMAMDGPIRPWPLMEMPPEALNWEPSSDVTLIGDAAHTTTPFIGDGANCAMRDAVLLADQLTEHGFGTEAIAAYEEQMFSFAKPMIVNSNFSGELFFAPDAPAGFVKAMKEKPFIGVTDNE